MNQEQDVKQHSDTTPSAWAMEKCLVIQQAGINAAAELTASCTGEEAGWVQRTAVAVIDAMAARCLVALDAARREALEQGDVRLAEEFGAWINKNFKPTEALWVIGNFQRAYERARLAALRGEEQP